MISLHVAGYPGEPVTLLRLMVLESSRLLLVSVGVGVLPVLVDAEPPFQGTPMIGCLLTTGV